MNADRTVRFLIGVYFLPAILCAQGGAPVEGVVIDSATHAGLAGVAVSIVSTSGQHRVTYSTSTDADGFFRIGNIDQDGEYKAVFEKTGFREAPPRTFSLSAAAGPVRINGELSPHPQLRGRVVDASGHPVSKARVELLSTRGNWAMTTPVGKDGVFVCRNSLPSGAFYLRAMPDPKLPPPESTGDEPLVWAPTYYPGGTDLSQATRVVWRGEADLDGYEIRLQAVPVFHVRGVVLDDTGKPVSGAAVKLLPADAMDAALEQKAQTEAQTATAKDGTFELAGVRPGDCRLAAEWKRGEQQLSGIAIGRVSRGDWEDARIHLDVPFAVKGVVEVPDGKYASGVVLLTPANRSIGVGASYNQEGRFEIRDVHPGRYQIVPAGPQTGLYLESVLYGGREVSGQTVDLADGSLPIRVIYKANGGRVQGSAEQCGAVVVFPKDASLRNGQLVRSGRCDAGGRFDIGGLRPGDYYAVALRVPELESQEQALDELLFDAGPVVAQIAGSGESVRVEAGQSTTVTLKAMPWPEQ